MSDVDHAGLTWPEIMCPICMDTLTDTTVVMECLHRFCNLCIETCLRASKLECPTCRIRVPSRRFLRRDHRFDEILALYPVVPDQTVTSFPYDRTQIVAWRQFHRKRTAELTSRRGRVRIPTDSRVNSDLASKKAKTDFECEANVNLILQFCGKVNSSSSDNFKSKSASCESSALSSDDVNTRIRDETSDIYSQPLDISCTDKINDMSKFYLERQFLRIPGKARLNDLRIYIIKMLNSSNVHMNPSQITFGVLGASKQVCFVHHRFSYNYNLMYYNPICIA